MRLRHLVNGVGFLAAALAVGVLACGEDDPPPAQAALWFGLSTGPGGMQCSSAKNYQFPPGAQQTIVSASGVGDRIVDGGQVLVTCQVYAAADVADAFDINADLSSGEVGNFSIRGRVSEAAGADVDISLRGAGFGLSQDGCTATVETVLGGAVWLKNLSCPNMRDPSSPGIACTAVGGIILENCSR